MKRLIVLTGQAFFSNAEVFEKLDWSPQAGGGGGGFSEVNFFSRNKDSCLARKNDHDQFIYNIRDGIKKSIRSHWMSGSTETEEALPWDKKAGSQIEYALQMLNLNVSEALLDDPLTELMQTWRSAGCRGCRAEASDRFWKDAEIAEISSADAADAACAACTVAVAGRPNYAAVPGWFTAPPDCTEIICEIVIGPVKILRLLINQEKGGTHDTTYECV